MDQVSVSRNCLTGVRLDGQPTVAFWMPPILVARDQQSTLISKLPSIHFAEQRITINGLHSPGCW